MKSVELDFATKNIAFINLAFTNPSNLLIVYNYTAFLVEISNSFK